MVASTPRQLPMQHMAKAIQNSAGDGGEPPLLGPDEMQLYSYYRPGLVAGEYEVAVVQKIEAEVPNGSDHVKKQTLVVKNIRNNKESKNINQNTDIVKVLDTVEPQIFNVVVPRFTLDPDLINSYYPPDGHQDEGRILPHVVLNDPHFPWEIDAGSTNNMHSPIDKARNLVPWIALVVFDPDELRLPTLEGDIKPLNIPRVDDVTQQNANGTFSMGVNEYFSALPKTSQVDIEKGYGNDTDLKAEIRASTDVAKVIFPTKKLFKDIFSDCESMKYLAHVRNINTVGFPDAGIEQLGLYSVVISGRTGRFDITKPTTQVCHLVSIENFDVTLDGVNKWLENPTPNSYPPPNTPDADKKYNSDRIGIFSLHSWVYTALPPDPVNFVDTVENLVKHQQMLRADQPFLDALRADFEHKAFDPTTPKGKASRVLLDRLTAGYTFARWRSETGEETTALNRGPLVPQRQPGTPTADLPDCSNTSKDFQILDKDTGLMDLSYSTAWQLGKTLAISDSVFSAAMLRFRSTLHNTTSSATRATLNDVKPKGELLKSLSVSLSRAADLSSGTPGLPERTRDPVAPSAPVVDVLDGDAKPVFKRKLLANVALATSAGSDQFNGFNTEPANDDDWIIIHNWMADKLFLADIPPQYLIPEASFVPAEGLRFFYIDDFWIDCLLDGALSVANHLDSDDDILRTDVKARFNKYLRTPVPDTGIKPQIPGYGFILRSKIIKTMPDLRMTVKWKVADEEGHVRHSVCRYTRFDDTTLICLLDRQPEELDYVELAQPPHQQRFSLGYNLYGPRKSETGQNLPGRLEFKIRKLYTADAPDGEWEMSTNQPEMQADPANAKKDQTQKWYDWNTRCIQLKTMMPELNELLQRAKSGTDGVYDDKEPNSCALGILLNDPSYYFVIKPPKGTAVPNPIVPRDRQLYINLEADLFEHPPAKKPLPPPSSTPVPPAKPPSKPLPPPATPAAPTTPSPPAIPIPPAPHLQTKTRPFTAALLAMRNIPRLPPGAAPIQLQSQFALNVYADYKPFPQPRDRDGFDPASYIPTSNLFFFDLIFSLRKIVSASKAPLLEIQIDIPNEGLSDPSGKDINKEPLIKQNYAGPGAKMISNQRFVPLIYTDTEYLRVRLIPRTAADNYKFEISDDRSKELSFRLAEADIAKVRAGQSVPMKGSPGKPQFRGISKVTMVEIYGAGPTGTWPVTSTVEVVKWGTRDAEDKALEEADVAERRHV